MAVECHPLVRVMFDHCFQKLTRGAVMQEDLELRDRIVDAAVIMGDASGVDSVSIRRLAERVGMPPMSLYRYFESKEALKDLMVARIMDSLEAPRLLSSEWRAHVKAVLMDFHGLLLEHPCLVELLSTQRVMSPGMTRLVDVVVTNLIAGGATDEEAVRGFGVLFSYVLGCVVYQKVRSNTDPRAAEIENRKAAERLTHLSERHGLVNTKRLALPLAALGRADIVNGGLNALIRSLPGSLGSDTK